MLTCWDRHPTPPHAGDHWAAIVCAAYTFLGFWFVGGLTALHGYLVSTNQTTYEHFRHRYSGGQLPCLLLLRLRLLLRLQLQNGKCAPGGPCGWWPRFGCRTPAPPI